MNEKNLYERCVELGGKKYTHSVFISSDEFKRLVAYAERKGRYPSNGALHFGDVVVKPHGWR